MNILFFPPYTFWRLHALYEVALLHNLRSRGHQVDMICCDGIFNECDMFWQSTVGERPANACEICQKSTEELVRAVNIDAMKIGDFINSHNDEIRSLVNNIPAGDLMNFIYDDYPVGDWVISSLHTHFRVNRINLLNKKQVEVFREYIYGGIILAEAAEKILNKLKPDVIVIFNGRLAPTRIFLEIARAKSIRIVCHERGICNESLLIYENSSCLSLIPFKEISEKWQEIPLNKIEVNAVFDWLEDRRSGKNLSWTAFSDNGEIDTVDTFINSNVFDRIWVLFTSSTDEIVSSPEFISDFGTQYDWIMKTIDYVKVNKNIGLIIRCHPNSGSSKSTGVNYEELNFYNTLSLDAESNVCFILPEDKTSSYKLMDIADLGLVYVSTVALEMACFGKNVILACRSPWSYCAGIEFIQDSSTYTDVLTKYKTSETVVSKSKISYAVRFAYGYIARWQLQFPLISMPDIHNGILNASDISQLGVGQDHSLDKFGRIVLGVEPAIPNVPRNIEMDVDDFDFISTRIS
jgi:hypothetical protein